MSPTRRQLLAAGAAGLVGAAAAPSAADADASPAPHGLADAEWLQRVFAVKLLSLYVYGQVLAFDSAGAGARSALRAIREQERVHVATLSDRLGDRHGGATPPVDDAEADRRLARRRVSGRLGQLKGPKDALDLLLSLERVTVGVCFVALRELRATGPTTLVAQIMAADAQHQVVVGERMHPGDLRDAVPYGLVQGVQ